AFIFIKNEVKKTRLLARQTYIDLNDKYLQFLALAVRYPRLDVAEQDLGGFVGPLTDEEKLQQWVLFSMLTSMIERAFLLGRSRLGRDAKEWLEWDQSVDKYAAKPNYRDFWRDAAQPGRWRTHDFDPDFEAFMHGKLAEAVRLPSAVSTQASASAQFA